MKYSLLVVLLISGVYGAILESNPEIQVNELLIGLHLAGLGAMSAVTLSVLGTKFSVLRISVFVVLQLIAFRTAYFPVMVLSATSACFSEWLMMKADPELPIKIFPVFFISVAMMFSAISYLIYISIKGESTAIILVAAIMIPMAMISFSTKDDLTLFPDDNWSGNMMLPAIQYPRQNPYLVENRTHDINTAQKVVALAGAMLYPLIPNSPWALASKGILEQAYRDNPEGSSRDRLADHYAAFLAAHKFVSKASKDAS